MSNHNNSIDESQQAEQAKPAEQPQPSEPQAQSSEQPQPAEPQAQSSEQPQLSEQQAKSAEQPQPSEPQAQSSEQPQLSEPQAQSSEQPQLSGRMGIIYKITCLINGKGYVGQTRQKLNRRINGHKNCKVKRGIDAAIEKYKWENFTVEVLEECHVELLDEREIFFIRELKTKAPNGYNLTDGGDSNLNPSPETCAKISANHADVSGEKNGFYGQHHSKESRAKMSAAKKGKSHKPHSPETKAKIAASNKGKHSQNKGKPLSEEHKAKIAAALKAAWARRKKAVENGGK